VAIVVLTAWFPQDRAPFLAALPTCAMTHIAVAEMQDGSVVTSMEKVTDEQYAGYAR
jgi:hypothetical protein